MAPLLIFIAALIIIGFIAFLFVYNFRTKHSTPPIPPVPPKFNDDFSREFNLGRRNNMPRATAPPMPPRIENTAGIKGVYVMKNGSAIYEPVNITENNGVNIDSTSFDDSWQNTNSADNDTTEFGGGDFGGGGAGGSYDDSGSSGSSDYSSDSGSSDSGSSYD